MSMSMSTVDFYSASPHPPLMRYMQSVAADGMKMMSFGNLSDHCTVHPVLDVTKA